MIKLFTVKPGKTIGFFLVLGIVALQWSFTSAVTGENHCTRNLNDTSTTPVAGKAVATSKKPAPARSNSTVTSSKPALAANLERETISFGSPTGGPDAESGSGLTGKTKSAVGGSATGTRTGTAAARTNTKALPTSTIATRASTETVSTGTENTSAIKTESSLKRLVATHTRNSGTTDKSSATSSKTSDATNSKATGGASTKTTGTKATGAPNSKTVGTTSKKTTGTAGTKTASTKTTGATNSKTVGTTSKKTTGTAGTKTNGTKAIGTTNSKTVGATSKKATGTAGAKTTGTKATGATSPKIAGTKTGATSTTGAKSGATSTKASALTGVWASKLAVFDSLRLKEAGLSKKVFAMALNGMSKLVNTRHIKDNLLAIIDYSQPSNKKRLYVIDLNSHQLLYNTYVAHGMKTGKAVAQYFSNKPASCKSSLGFYITGSTYQGANGYSLKLQGVEKGINDHAMDRGIVIHGADYVCEGLIESQGFIGRSWGCPAVSLDISQDLIDLLKDGSCLFIYHPSPAYKTKSALLQ